MFLKECPEKWEYYQEIYWRTPVIIWESQRKHPGKLFFSFTSLKSSPIEKIETYQTTIDSKYGVKIWTKNSYYEFQSTDNTLADVLYGGTND